MPTGKFNPANVLRNLSNDASKRCGHRWMNIETKKVIRNGFGTATKVMNQKCALCGATRNVSKKYTDERVDYND